MKPDHLVDDDVETPLLVSGPSVDSSQSQPGHARKKPLTLLPLIAIIFFEVSGGPFGTEDAVAAAGPLLVLLGFMVLPLVWSIPEALITAELATAFPENSGYVAWVTAAFGPFWGFQEGFWSWLSGVTDNSIYPVMFADNLRIFFPALNDGWPRMVFLLVLSLLLTYLNYRGLHVVGNFAITTTILIAMPFLLLCALALPQAQPANWLKVDYSTVQWGTFLNIMFWNLNYWDSVSCLAGEVDNPSKIFPRALLWGVLLVTASYLLPTLAALGISVDTADWELGYYGKVAQQVGGNWLAWWIVLAAAASQIGQFQAEMSSDSYQLMGMAERGFLPRALARRSRHGTPTYGIILSSLGVLCLASFSFVDIVELLNAVYCLAELLEFAAFVWLRIKAPMLPRPYRVPLPVWALVLMLLPATILLLAVLVTPMLEHNYTMMCATGGAMVLGFVLYPLLSCAKERNWFDFTDLQFDYAHVPDGRVASDGQSYTIHASGHLNYDPSYNAEYVDVVHDGVTRQTGSSMDLGSGAGSSRAPGSVTGSLSGFGVSGSSPRSPILIHHGGRASRAAGHERAGSAPAAAAAAAAAAVPADAVVAAGPAAGVSGVGSRLRPPGFVQHGGFDGAGSAPAAVTLTSADDQQDQQPFNSQQPAAGGSGSGAATSARQMARQISSFRVRISEGGLGDEDDDAEEDTAGSSAAAAAVVQQSPFMAVAGASDGKKSEA